MLGILIFFYRLSIMFSPKELEPQMALFISTIKTTNYFLAPACEIFYVKFDFLLNTRMSLSIPVCP